MRTPRVSAVRGPGSPPTRRSRTSDAAGKGRGWAGATKDARRLAGSTTGIIAKAVAFLVDSGF
ncbi:hypothetical protein AB0435_32395, partial [Streptomyces sp. NPDC051173]